MSYKLFRYCPLRICVTAVIIEIIICIIHTASCEENKIMTLMADGSKWEGVSTI